MTNEKLVDVCCLISQSIATWLIYTVIPVPTTTCRNRSKNHYNIRTALGDYLHLATSRLGLSGRLIKQVLLLLCAQLVDERKRQIYLSGLGFFPLIIYDIHQYPPTI